MPFPSPTRPPPSSPSHKPAPSRPRLPTPPPTNQPTLSREPGLAPRPDQPTGGQASLHRIGVTPRFMHVTPPPRRRLCVSSMHTIPGIDPGQRLRAGGDLLLLPLLHASSIPNSAAPYTSPRSTQANGFALGRVTTAHVHGR
ncbi:hypothetical protein VC83_03691 [Pseudogymnoascus destructans]|uniref:Uncharacterized protein n=2 Tax=Pseudogymnoascus destructans TaxID=655981 RepID=L8G3B6_PSED2|nr:uncharacterized protein VC83_03691 [Pseudogymnoascus destructans]ELR07597.1 hypothetical protein GMDG_02645 [Pseudogymnoascus destructans 20631-21]OAF59837.1 hypothetical protein VC83_03691 [Pseudogymnoascus destructans]